MTALAENLWLLRYPLKLLGVDMRRNVTVIRLRTGELVIHSTAPFSPEDISHISQLGRPGWLVEAMIDHDTFAQEGRAAFPDVPYFAPPGFDRQTGLATSSLDEPPSAWEPELKVLKVEGVPKYQEYVFFHQPSRTLIVADLVFNFGDDEPLWTELLLRVAIGSEHHPGMSRPFKAAIKDEEAFRRSMSAMLAWDFDRLIPGHGEVLETGAKSKVEAALKTAGF